jgi:hypothetical protein
MILYGHTHDYHGVFSYIFPLGFKEFYPDISMYIYKFFPQGFSRINNYDEHWRFQKIIDQGEC